MTPASPAAASPRGRTSLPVRAHVSRWGRRGRTVLITLLLGVLIAGPTAAWGAWHSQATLAPATASGGVVQPPTGLRCSTEGGFLGRAEHVVLSWAEPTSGAPARYRILAHAEGETYTLGEIDGARHSFEVRVGLLTGLLEGLLNLIIRDARPPITVVAVHDSGWESEETDSVAIRLGLLGLTGLRCA